MRSKGKQKNIPSLGKNPPLNINISFNINPKNILHHQLPTDLKYHQRMQSEQMSNTAKGKFNKNRKPENQLAEGVTQRTVKKVNMQGLMEGQISKKELEKIKKKFLNRINNMDITLAIPANESKLQKEEDDVNQSSLMSARMEQYQTNPVKKSSESLQFNFNSISGKSKILTNNEPSKILPGQAFKKSKYQQKPFDKRVPNMTQSKQTKYYTHYKGFSTFTDIKGSPQKYHKKKAREVRKAKQKQQNLQDKLERFKLDMMKLALAYDESEVLKTKLSSEYYNNIRSRQISKQVVDVQRINEVQEHEKSEEIKNYQAKQPSKELTPQQESQSFKQLKDVYQDLERKKKVDQGGQCTQNIVQYYTQLTSEPKCIIDQPIDESDQSDKSVNSSLWSKQEDSESITNKLAKSQQHKKQLDLQQFVKFLQQKLALSPNKNEITKQLTTLLQQYTKKQEISQKLHQQQSKQPQIKPLQCQINNRQGHHIENIDQQINKQLIQIPYLKDELIDNYRMNGDQMFELEQWEENYKNQLLKIKGKMWKQYKTIRNVIESRILGGNFSNEKAIQTNKIKKQNKIMKCLSEKLFLKNQVISSSIESLELKNERVIKKLTKEKGFLIKQEHLLVEPSLSDQNSDSQNDLEILDGQPGFIPISSDIISSKASQKDENMIISSLVKIQMEDKQSPFLEHQTITSLHKLTEQDKQDIFQFIFLDICIELYQEAIDDESQLSSGGLQKNQPAIRILNSIKVYIELQKKRKNERENRKIGISTNVNKVKESVQQISQFVLSNRCINNSTLNNRERMMKKLNTPLGPSEVQILKSLRLSLFNNQPVDDYGDDVEQADLLVLEPDLFLFYENEVVKIQQLSFPKYYDDQKRDEQRINFLRNCTHIHQKAIFDCLNENLDYHRAYGIWGRPFIWKKSSLFQHTIKDSDLNNAMAKSIGQVIKCSAFVCGLMVNKEDSLIKDIASDSSYVRRLQDERIYKLLQHFVLEMEEKWFFHDDQEAEIIVELSHIVWTLLIKEVLKQIQFLFK